MMQFHNTTADFFVPDGMNQEEALARTTHLSVGAHQDDIEIMAYHGIASCYGRADQWMTGVVVTNGAGSARSGIYGQFTDEAMQNVRKKEQQKAAYVGEYGAMIQLDFTSSQVKNPKEGAVIEDLKKILEAARPRIVYLHNPADKHDTHVAVTLRALEALRQLPRDARPKKVFGCEVWRSLDWLCDEDKEVLSVSDFPNLAASLVGIFDSQITGGKRYDLATSGRRVANATYFASHKTDEEEALTFALDLTVLIEDRSISVAEYTRRFIQKFQSDVESRLTRLS